MPPPLSDFFEPNGHLKGTGLGSAFTIDPQVQVLHENMAKGLMKDLEELKPNIALKSCLEIFSKKIDELAKEKKKLKEEQVKLKEENAAVVASKKKSPTTSSEIKYFIALITRCATESKGNASLEL